MQRKHIKSTSHQSQILILKMYGQDLGNMFKQPQIQDLGHRINIEPQSHDMQSQMLILKT